MNKHRLLVGVITLVVVVGGYWCFKKTIDRKVADLFVISASKAIQNSEAVTFRYENLDSLYNTHKYAYFLLVREETGKENSTFSHRDSTLIIKSSGLDLRGMNIENDYMVEIPESACSVLLDKDQMSMLYRVELVTRDTLNTYRLEKMP